MTRISKDELEIHFGSAQGQTGTDGEAKEKDDCRETDGASIKWIRALIERAVSATT